MNSFSNDKKIEGNLTQNAAIAAQQRHDDYYTKVYEDKKGSVVDIKSDKPSGAWAYAKDLAVQTTIGAAADLGNLAEDVGHFTAGVVMNTALGQGPQFGAEFDRSFGSPDDQNFFQVPHSENVIPEIARFVSPVGAFGAASKIGKAFIGTGKVGAFALSRMMSPSAYIKYGPKLGQALQSERFNSIAIGAVANYLTGARAQGNVATIIEDWAERHGYKSEFVRNWFAVDQDDSATERAMKSVFDAATIELVGRIVGPRAIRGMVALADKTGAPGKIVEMYARAHRAWQRLKRADPNEVERVQGIIKQINALTDAEGKLRVGGEMEYDDMIKSEFVDPNAPSPEPKPKMGPEKPGMIDAMLRQGEAVDPTSPINNLRREYAKDVGAEAAIRQFMFESSDPAMKEAVRTAYNATEQVREARRGFMKESRDSSLKALTRRSYDAGDLKWTSLALNRYSKAFWKNAEAQFKQAGISYSRRDLAALKKFYDGQATNFGRATGMPEEAYYWYRFGNSSFDAVRTVKDLNAGLAGLPANSKMLLQSAKTIIGHDGHAADVPGASSRYYSVDDAGNMTRVDYDLPQTGGLDLDQTYAEYAVKNGEEAGRKLVEATPAVIDDAMKATGLDREGAIKAVLSGTHEDTRLTYQIANNMAGADVEKLKAAGFTHAVQRHGEAEIVNVFDESAVKDFGFSGAAHEVSAVAAPILKPETEAAVRAAFKAATPEARDAAVRSIDDPEALKAIIDGLGPDEWVPVIRARGFANAKNPDGEFVEVTTNPRARGNKLWVRKSDIVAPSEDGFFARSSKAIPEEEFSFQQDPNMMGGKPRGAIQFDNDGRAIITLFSGSADKSTFLHETGHLFFRDLEWTQDVPLGPLHEWLGVKEGIPFDRWPVEAQEKWARGFERYIATGKAPAGLESVFTTTRNWMRQVYSPIAQSAIAEKAPKEIQEFMGKIVSGGTVTTAVERVWAQQEIMNYDTINDAEGVRLLLEDFAKAGVTIVDRVSGKRKTFDDVVLEAAAKNMTVNAVLGMPEGLPHDVAFSLRAFKETSTHTVQDLADRWVESMYDPLAGLEAREAFKKAVTVHAAVDVRDMIESKYLGRGLAYRRIKTGGDAGEADRFKAVSKVISAMKNDSFEELAVTIQKLRNNPDAISRIVDQIEHPKFFDALHEMFISGLISSPTTLVANLFGGIQAVSHLLLMTKLTATANRMIGREGVNQLDVDADFMGLMRGLPQGIKIAREMAKDGWIDPTISDKFGNSKVNQFQSEAFRPTAFGRELYSGDMGMVGRAIDAAGWVIRAPGRAARGTDGFFKAVLYNIQLQRNALREARVKIEQEVANGNTPSEQQVAAWIQDYVSNPTVESVISAKKFSLYHTFHEGFSGKTGATFGSLASTNYARKIVPFLRIGAEISRYAMIEMTPAGLATKRFRERLFSKDMATRQIAQTQLGLNTLMFLAVGGMIDNGMMSGSYSEGKDKATMRQGEMRRGVAEYSISVTGPDGKYHTINRLAPVGMAMTTMARFWELSKHLTDGELGDLAMKIGVAMADEMSAFGQAETFTDFYEAIHSGDKEKFSAVIGKIAGGHIPYSGALAAVERTMDPAKSMTNVSPVSHNHEIIAQAFNEVEARIPFLSRRLLPQYDIYGREMVLPQNRSETWMGKAYGFVSPSSMSSRDPDVAKYEEMYKRIKWFPDATPRFINIAGKSIELDDAEFAMYSRESGIQYKKLLDKYGDRIDTMEDEYKKAVLQQLLSSARSMGQGKVIKNFKRLTAMDLYKPQPFEAGTTKEGVWGMTPDMAQGIRRGQ